MIHKYTLYVKEDLSIPLSNEIDFITLNNNCKISWQKDKNGNLEKIILEILGMPVKRDTRGVILSSYPEIDAIAYNTASFLANQIFIQTSIDAIDPLVILSHSPELVGESNQETEELKNCPKRVFTSLSISAKILGRFNPDNYDSYYILSVAVAHFANAWRQKEPFIKFEQFYKVIESVYKKANAESAHTFDERVSNHILKYDNNFTTEIMKNLRQIRNRCVHPTAHLGHLSPDDLVAVRDIKGALKLIERLARLSLDHPPE